MSMFGNQKEPGYEFAVVMLVARMAACLAGPGRYSVDDARGWRLARPPWGLVGVILGLVGGLSPWRGVFWGPSGFSVASAFGWSASEAWSRASRRRRCGAESVAGSCRAYTGCEQQLGNRPGLPRGCGCQSSRPTGDLECPTLIP